VIDKQKWDELAKKFSRYTDRIGMPIDEGIFETVVALNALDIPTSMSCEGQLHHGLPYPWIDVSTPSFVKDDTPETTEILELQRRLIELRREQEKDLKRQQLRMESETLDLQRRHKVFGYLSDFYKQREVPFDRIITFEQKRIRSQGGAYLPLLIEDERAKKMNEYRDEMRDFTDFLKSIYFDSSEVHEMTDQ
jgi:hypothetical protein